MGIEGIRTTYGIPAVRKEQDRDTLRKKKEQQRRDKKKESDESPQSKKESRIDIRI